MTPHVCLCVHSRYATRLLRKHFHPQQVSGLSPPPPSLTAGREASPRISHRFEPLKVSNDALVPKLPGL